MASGSATRLPAVRHRAGLERRRGCGDADFTLTVPDGEEGVVANFSVHTPDPYL
jgi:hypothetical protein